MKITLENYPQTAAGLDTSQLDAADRGVHSNLLEFGAELVEDYPPDALEKVAKWISRVNRMMEGSGGGRSDDNGPAKPAPRAKKEPKPRAPRQPAAKKEPAAKKQPAAKKTAKEVAGGNVAALSVAVKLLRSFLTILGKQVTTDQVAAKLRSIQNAMVTKQITKTSPHSSLVDAAQDFLLLAVQHMTPSDSVKLTVADEKLLAKIVGAAGGEAVYESVAILKSFVRLSGRQATETQLKNLLKRTVSPRLKEGDPFQDEIKAVQVALKAAKPDAVLRSKPVGLAGIHQNRLAGLGALIRTVDWYATKHRRSRTAAKKKTPRKASSRRPKASPKRPRPPRLAPAPRLTAEW